MAYFFSINTDVSDILSLFDKYLIFNWQKSKNIWIVIFTQKRYIGTFFPYQV